MNTKKVWFITGASKGLGLTLVKKLLSNGYNVAATSRSLSELSDNVGRHENFLPLEVDLVNEQDVARAISETISTYGTIDVVVNNAGYAQVGTLEELSDAEARMSFDVNVFGTLNVIRQVMPHLRKNKSGHIFNISSIAGFLGTFPGWGIYTSTKFAVVGMTEALSAEIKSLGVTATIVYPGYFKTNFLLKGSLRITVNKIDDYKEAREMERAHKEDIHGNQPGDPEKAAAALIQVAASENPPLHLFLGSDSIGMAKAKLETIQHALNETEAIGLSTDFLK